MAEKYLLAEQSWAFQVPQRTFDTTVKMKAAQIAAFTSFHYRSRQIAVH